MDSNQQEILKKIIEACQVEQKEITSEKVERLDKLLVKLNKITTQKRSYVDEEGASRTYYTIGGSSYLEAYKLVIEVLDILRGTSLEIVIQKYEKGKLVVYKGKEIDLVLKNNGSRRQIEYDLKASADKIKAIAVNEAFQKHYENFRNIANEHIKHTWAAPKENSKKRLYGRANEGHITEAYQRHLILRHGTDDFNNFSAEKLSIPEVIILLYYSLGNTPWYKQGDIGYLQVKQNNTYLASYSSIGNAIRQLQALFDAETFDVNEFNKAFTASDQDQITDYLDLPKEKLEKIIDEVMKNNRINKDLTKRGLRIDIEETRGAWKK